MPKETFGGDDDKGGSTPPPPKKKLTLDKFGLTPDVNIRDVFWKIMASYAATKKPGVDLAEMGNEIFAILRVSISVISNANSEQYGLSPKFIAQYTVMLLVDGGWEKALVEFLTLSADQKTEVKVDIAHGLKKLMVVEKYGKAIVTCFVTMLRGRDSAGIALEYIANLNEEGLVRALKKEIIIMARGDIGDNQMNAIKAISLIKDDEEVRKTLIVLLSHWDVETRRAAVEILKTISGEDEVREAAEKRISFETDETIKMILTKIAK
ncbi:Uncharacterised protein [Candidatus Bilamarchaeum dharawalense]|uniref:HEAT repeats n=1 Tax=Candidatus Bilamarchaeum dharawalense TaxID=2885759 RepID=A0A5E4LPU4_9ARCH|nr:Uncharacterised protein [Candidatus Bilamarchaeum dharawalense]